MNRNIKTGMIIGLTIVFLGFATAGVAAAGKKATIHPAKKDTAAVVKAVKQAPSYKLLFFMNPNGRPCQMQNAILEEIKDSLANLAQVTYIKTTDPGDRDAFFTYGIRGLPSLIIVDRNGREIKRFTPGIQSKETILAALHRTTK
jgi:thioredoxin 1